MLFGLDGISALGAAGLVGVGLYIAAYTLLQLGMLHGGTVAHTSLNLVAASCVLISLVEHFNLSSAVIQIIWIIISLIGLTRIFLVKKMIHFDMLELVFLKTKLPGLPNDQAKRFFKNGQWVAGQTGDVLTEQGQQVEYLIYLADGSANVLFDGEVITNCQKGNFIGEITYLNGEPATGTVVLSEPSTYFKISAEAVKDLTKYNKPLFNEIEKSIANDLREKISKRSKSRPE